MLIRKSFQANQMIYSQKLIFYWNKGYVPKYSSSYLVTGGWLLRTLAWLGSSSGGSAADQLCLKNHQKSSRRHNLTSSLHLTDKYSHLSALGPFFSQISDKYQCQLQINQMQKMYLGTIVFSMKRMLELIVMKMMMIASAQATYPWWVSKRWNWLRQTRPLLLRSDFSHLFIFIFFKQSSSSSSL